MVVGLPEVLSLKPQEGQLTTEQHHTECKRNNGKTQVGEESRADLTSQENKKSVLYELI